MKYGKILFLFFICTITPCIAQKFDTVATLYNQKEYDQAFDVLNTMNPKNPSIWYNMGNCAYKKQDFYHAWAYWNCAHAVAPNSIKNTIEYNIEVVERKLQHPAQEGFFKKIFVLYRSVALIIFQFFFLISWFALLFFIKKYKHGTKYRSVFFILLLCITTVSGMALGFKYRTLNQRRGIVMKHDVSLFAGPDDQYHVLGSLEGVSEVVVHESRASWYKVSTKNNSGWVMQDSIVVV